MRPPLLIVFTDVQARDDALLAWAGSSREDGQSSDLADGPHVFVQTKAGCAGPMR